MLARFWRKVDPSAPLVGMQTGAATVENSMEFPRKLKMQLPFDPAILLLGIYPKEHKTLIQKNVSTPVFIAALFTMAKIWKLPKSTSFFKNLFPPVGITAITDCESNLLTNK